MTALVLDSIRREAALGPLAGARKAVGWAVALTGAIALATMTVETIAVMLGQPRVLEALNGGLVAALATAAGALPVLLARRISARMTDAFLGFGAGVMLAATAFSLVIPALGAAGGLGASKWAAAALVATGIAAGALALLAIDRALPHEHPTWDGAVGGRADVSRMWLFVAAIALHNIPEGLAIGVGYAQESAARGAALAGGIAIQDMPEGLVVAAALASVGYRRGLAFVVAALAGVVEPAAAMLGAGVVITFGAVLPLALAFAAGAMLFVVSHEIIPESHRRGHEAQATIGLIIGFCMMMMLDTALG